MVLLVTPKFEFLTEKQRLKVKNDHFLIVFTGGRARTIIISPYFAGNFYLCMAKTYILFIHLLLLGDLLANLGEESYKLDIRVEFCEF